MGQIGELLTRIRKKKDLSLREVEQATKIRIKYLEALEQENFKELPGEVYVIGFLRTYCRYLGLEADVIVEEYKKQFSKPEKIEEEIDPTPSYSGNKLPYKLVISIVLGVILLFLAGSLLIGKVYFQSQPASTPTTNERTKVETDNPLNQESQKSQPIDNSQGNNVQTPATGNSSTPVSQGITVKLEIVKGKCWVKVSTDDHIVFTGTLEGPLVKEFSAENEIRMVFGNAGVIKLYRDGQDVGKIGEMGEVITKIFKKD